MLTCYTGVMGAGKTYRLVYRIKNEFSKAGLVLTNINGIHESDTVKHFEFILHDFKHYDPSPDSFKQDKSPFETLVLKIRKDFNLSDDGLIYFCIDEAQNFYKQTKDQDVFYSIEKCRHYGVEFHLTCQDIKALPKRIYELCEVEQRAIPARYCIPGFFGYKKMVNGQMTGSSWMLKRKSVFDYYKSQIYGKPKKSVNWLFVGVFAVLLYGVYFMHDLVTGGLWDDEQDQQAVDVDKKDISLSKNVHKFSRKLISRDSNDETNTSDEGFEPECALPEIVEFFSDNSVQYKLDSGFLARLPVEQFIDKFPPYIYAYSYFFMPGERFIVFSQLTNSMIFPRKFKLVESQRIEVADISPSQDQFADSSPDFLDSSEDSPAFYGDDTDRLKRKYQQELDRLHDKYRQVL